MEEFKLSLAPRAVTGKKVKRLRQEGKVPVHLYGGSIESQTLQVDAQVLRRILPQVGGNVPLTVAVDGRKGDNICFVREVQRHPVTEEVLHVDFLRVEATQTVTAEVPIILEGEAPAVRNMGGTLVQPMQTLQVESLPTDMPAAIPMDVSGLEDFEKAIRVSDVVLATGVTILADPAQMIARVMPPRIEEEPEVPEEEAELEEGEELEGAEEGEAAPGEEPDQRGPSAERGRRFSDGG